MSSLRALYNNNNTNLHLSLPLYMTDGNRNDIIVRAAFRMDRILTKERLRELGTLKVKAVCQLCKVIESRKHVITDCKVYEKERNEIKNLAESINVGFSEQFVLAPEQIPTISDITTIKRIYTTTNKMLHKIYNGFKRRYKTFITNIK